jgi:glycosyltransferase involved in cell wall biosynthesis
MKILILQDYLRSGGTERQSILLARGFAAAGHETTLLTFRPGGPLASTLGSSVRHRALQPFDTGLDWFAPGLIAAARRVDPEIILCMGRMANCYGASLQQACRKAAVIATMRTGKTLPWLFRRSLRRVPQVVANSREAKDALVAQHGIPADKIAVIYNSLVFPAASSLERNDTLRRERGAGPGTLVLLCVAMFRPEKNQRELIEIAAGLPPSLDWQLWLAGEGPALRECEQLAAQKNLGPRVQFLGFQRDPSALYRAADVAVHASASESLSNFLVEAQAHGLPAVAYTAQGIAECFVPEKTGWVIGRGDAAAFRATVARLAAEDAGQRARRSAEAREFARQTFDPQRQLAAYLELFARLAPAAEPDSPLDPAPR